MKWYTYEGAAKLRSWMSIALGVFLIVGLTVLALILAWPDMGGPAPSSFVCLALWCLGIGWLFGTFFLWAYPDVQVGEHGLALRVLWMKIHVAWSDVLGTRTRGFPWGNVRLVYARRITPFHILYSWQYARLMKPGFFVASSMQDFDELMKVFRKHGIMD